MEKHESRTTADTPAKATPAIRTVAKESTPGSRKAPATEPTRSAPSAPPIATPASRSLPETLMDDRDDVLSVINELEDQLDRHEEVRVRLEKELHEAAAQLQTAHGRTQELEWQVATLQTRVEAFEQLRQEVDALEEEIADGNGRIARIGDQLAASEKENSRLSHELKSANKQLEELWTIRKERDGLRSDLKTTRARAETSEQTARELTEERQSLSTMLKDAQAALDELRQVRHQLEIDLRTSDDRAAELRRTNEGLEQKIEAGRNERKSLQAQITHLERENARVAEQAQYYECELTSLRGQNRNAEAALSAVKKAFAEVRTALSETKTRARRRMSDSLPRVAGVLQSSEATRTEIGPSIEQIDELIERGAQLTDKSRSELISKRTTVAGDED